MYIYGLLVSKDLVSLIYQERERKQRKMAAPILTLIAASLLMGCTNSAMAWKETYGVINVAGKVMCQDCTKGYNDWINGDRPIKGTPLPLYSPCRLCDVFTGESIKSYMYHSKVFTLRPQL
jgi:hypothetical protein